MFSLLFTFYIILSCLPDDALVQAALSYTMGYQSSFKMHTAATMNLILTAPHGGTDAPVNVPTRSIGGCRRTTGPNANTCTWWYNDTCTNGIRCATTVVRDSRSNEFAENVANYINQTWGKKPKVLIAMWNRSYIDFNREIEEATLHHPEPWNAYLDFHSKLNEAIDDVNQTFGKGLLIDIHGHQQGNYTMVGYLLNEARLNQPNLTALSVTTSIERLCGSNRENCIRGTNSFGTIFESKGLGDAIPSLAHKHPGTLEIYAGGYITSNYIAKIHAIQTELPTHLRTSSNRVENAQRFAQAVMDYMTVNNILATI